MRIHITLKDRDRCERVNVRFGANILQSIQSNTFLQSPISTLSEAKNSIVCWQKVLTFDWFLFFSKYFFEVRDCCILFKFNFSLGSFSLNEMIYSNKLSTQCELSVIFYLMQNSQKDDFRSKICFVLSIYFLYSYNLL